LKQLPARWGRENRSALRGGSEEEILESTREKFNSEHDPRIKAKLGWMVDYLTDVLDEFGDRPQAPD
jgi:hypothetical protein